MSEWIPITEKMPDFDDYMDIWAYDGKAVMQRHRFEFTSTYRDKPFFTHWKPIFIPEPPKKKESHHCCKREWRFSLLSDKKHYAVCEETCGQLYLTAGKVGEPSLYSTDVKFCPFCGYSPEKKDD